MNVIKENLSITMFYGKDASENSSTTVSQRDVSKCYREYYAHLEVSEVVTKKPPLMIYDEEKSMVTNCTFILYN